MSDLNVIVMTKGLESYAFLYDDANRAEVIRTARRFAGNPDLSFSWYDAAELSQRVRSESKRHDDPFCEGK